MLSQARDFDRRLPWLKTPAVIVVLLIVVSGSVYSLQGMNTILGRDNAIFLYAGEQFADGVPPYVSIFENKGPMPSFLAGWSISLARPLGIEPIYVVRAAFLLLSSMSVAALFLLAFNLFHSRSIGLLSALTFLTFLGFGRFACAGPRAKTPMVLFQILALTLMVRRSWFWASFCGALACLVWQPAGIFVIAPIVLSYLQSTRGRERVDAVRRALLGGAFPFALTAAYYAIKGNLLDAVYGFGLFNFVYLSREARDWHEGIVNPLRAIYIKDPATAPILVAGFIAMLALYVVRVRGQNGSIARTLKEDAFAGVLLTFPIPIIWSYFDFQKYPDAFVFLPYLVVAFAWGAWCAVGVLVSTLGRGRGLRMAILAVLAVASVGTSASRYVAVGDQGLLVQQRQAKEIRAMVSPGTALLAIGSPQIHAILNEANLTRYGIMIVGMGAYIDDKEPGGFEGWLERIESQKPPLVIHGYTSGLQATKLRTWIQNHYREIDVGFPFFSVFQRLE